MVTATFAQMRISYNHIHTVCSLYISLNNIEEKLNKKLYGFPTR